jgi:hypothetical protein
MSRQMIRQATGLRVWCIFRVGLILTFCSLRSVVSATTIDDLSLEGSYGTGNHRAALVVDFLAGNNANDSFAFEVKFDTDTIDGFDLMDIIETECPNPFDYWDRSDGYVSLISYTPRPGETYESSWYYDNLSWNYWTMDADSTWSYSWEIGFADVKAGDGDIVGWVAQAIGWDGSDFVPPVSEWASPVVPLKPTPEPSTFALIATGGLAAIGWRWRRRKA